MGLPLAYIFHFQCFRKVIHWQEVKAFPEFCFSLLMIFWYFQSGHLLKKNMASMLIFTECRSKTENNVISYTKARMI